jgi:tetratricopeptide (TPR) repeat protein
MGKIADILATRGDPDGALRIRQEEQLPVFDQLGDARSRAVTMGKIADILFARGNLDGALRIRQEEELPVYERLGDVRERAITMGKIADILFTCDDLDGALRIRLEEQLPVYERLGHVRERTLTMSGIADIFIKRGNLDEALQTFEELLPIAKQLGDTEGISYILLSTSRIRVARGIKDADSLNRILNDLREAYALAKRRTQLNAVCEVASCLGQVLVHVGAKDLARPLLIEARDGRLKLGHTQKAAQLGAILQQLQ